MTEVQAEAAKGKHRLAALDTAPQGAARAPFAAGEREREEAGTAVSGRPPAGSDSWNRLSAAGTARNDGLAASAPPPPATSGFS